MHVLEIILILCLNAVLIWVMQSRQNRSLKQQLNNFKQEIQELEDLAAAIIEEFEEAAGMIRQNSDDIPAQTSDEIGPSSVKSINSSSLSKSSKQQLIMELSNQGLSVEEIAKELKIGRGEVSLVLGLYRRS